MVKASSLFSEEDKKKVEEALDAAEKKTSGEIVPVVATASGRYDRAEDVFGLLTAIAAVAVAWLLFQEVGIQTGDWGPRLTMAFGLPTIILLIIGGFAVGSALATWFPALKLPFLRKREMHEEVERCTEAVFQRFRVRRTAGGTGILIYISLFERTVRVLGDDNITEKLDSSDWEGVCSLIRDGLKAGRAAEGLAKGIERCGDLLSKHFPIQPDDVNELTNELRLIN